MTKDQELFGNGDLAKWFGVSPGTIKRWDRLGILPPAKRIAGRRVWTADDLPAIQAADPRSRDGRRKRTNQ